jgi:AcrR family transcriptional regulator
MATGMKATTRTGAPRRRTQAERSATTRAKVVDAAAYCISKYGLNNTTTASIADRAGVTWGAIQHQFGGKDAIFLALIDRSLDELVASVRESVADADDLERRVQGFVGGLWKVYRTPVFRAVLEILLGRRSDDARAYEGRPEEFCAVLSDLFDEIFDAFSVAEDLRKRALRFSLATLAGFALEETFRSERDDFAEQLDTLSRAVVAILAGPAK